LKGLSVASVSAKSAKISVSVSDRKLEISVSFQSLVCISTVISVIPYLIRDDSRETDGQTVSIREYMLI